jgi:hypothetical protein
MMPMEARLGGIGTALIANSLRSVKRGCWAPHCKAARLDGDKSGPMRMLLISLLLRVDLALRAPRPMGKVLEL